MAELEIVTLTVGEFAENCTIVRDRASGTALVIDPGDEAHQILAAIGDLGVEQIVLTHAHRDHIGAVNQIRASTGASVAIHPADAHMLGPVRADIFLRGDETIALGAHVIRLARTPGHTPGMLSLLLPNGHAIVGDTIFDGGPGKTWCPDDFQTTLRTLREVVLRWPDETICHPGHGATFRLGDRRAQIAAFVERDHDAGFFGDAEW